ncbi:MAG TPA: Gfo/Idh/MocA family oxidoreductase [Candidatus Hydrogenedens sp.]|nr:Gfo/Idh/MocA family oxidoreductase [Candidatus Hydrogenedens sp.]
MNKENIKLRVGVIGFGYLGYHHARIYSNFEDVELVGIVDISEERRKKAQNDFHVPAFSSVEELLDKGVDITSVATPTLAHACTTISLLEAGVHVLVEKPISTTVLEAKEMVEKAKSKGCILQVGHVERFNGAVRALFNLIEYPRFIECHRLSPFPGRGTDVSVVHDLMIHDIDIVLALTKSSVVSMDAVGVPVFSSSEDIANARIHFQSGCVANLTASRVSMDRLRKIRIFSEREYVSTDYSSQSLLIYRKKPGKIPPDSNPMEFIEITPIQVSNEEPLKAELRSFVASVKNGIPPEVSGEDGLKALELSTQIVEQIWRGM